MLDYAIGAAIGAVAVIAIIAVLIAAGVLPRPPLRRTDREGTDQRVTTMSQVMQLAIQNAPTGLVVVDVSKDVILSNPSAHVLDMVHERTLHDRCWGAATRVFDSQETEEEALTIPSRRPGGPSTYVRCVATPLTLADDRFVVLYGVDESDLVRMESARRDFVANVSHELKTPVGALSLLVEALMQAKDDAEAVDRFGTSLMRESNRMSRLITELISLSKLQGAEALPDMAPVRVRDVIDTAISRTRQLAADAGIHVTATCPGDLTVMGDKNLLVTAVTNLINNAINYSPEQTSVSISCTRQDRETVAIRVTDRGIGISLADQERIFERFFRVDKARSRATGGTGLGLAIVKHVVANHGGAIKLWSRPGTGSTFTLELPATGPHSPQGSGDIRSSEKDLT